MADNRLLVFTKIPRPGEVKSRLVPALGVEGAAKIQREMAEYTLNWARAFQKKRNWAVEVWYAGGRKKAVEWLDDGWSLWEQRGVDIGARIFNAFFDVFREGCRKAVMVRTDCPELTAAHVRRAFSALDNHDVVLSPTRDGGYCLVGLNAPRPELFSGIPWGSKSVLKATLEKIKEEKLEISSLEPMRDVVYPQDLAVWSLVKNRSLSIIIPTKNAGESLIPCLDRIEKDGHTEVIVSDGGSTDGTRDKARSWGATLAVSRRAEKHLLLNAGAEAAAGSILLFLRPGFLLPEGYAHKIRDVQDDPSVSIGAFPIREEQKNLPFPTGSRAAGGFIRRKRIPWGEQEPFIRRSLFRELGGFREMQGLEQADLIRRALAWGDLALIPASVSTSLVGQLEPEQRDGGLKKRLKPMGWNIGLSLHSNPRRRTKK